MKDAISPAHVIVRCLRGGKVEVIFDAEIHPRTTRQLATQVAELLGYRTDGSAFALADPVTRVVRHYDEPQPLYGEWELVEVGLNV